MNLEDISLIIDLDALAESDPALFQRVSRTVGTDTGEVKVELKRLSARDAEALYDSHALRGLSQPPPPQPVVDRVIPQEEWDYRAELRADILDTTASNRLMRYHREQGLLDNQHNRDLIISYIRERSGGFFTASNVDVAVGRLRDQLQWHQEDAFSGFRR